MIRRQLWRDRSCHTPQAVFERVGAALVTARDKRRLCASNRLQRRDRIVGAADMRRIGAQPDHDKIIPRDLPAVDAVAGRDEFLLSLGVMNQNQIGVVARRGRRMSSRSLRNNH